MHALLRALRQPLVSKKQIRRQGVNKSGTQSLSASTWTTVAGLAVNSSFPNTTINGGNALTIEDDGSINITIALIFSVTTANAKQYRLVNNGTVIFTQTSTSQGNILITQNNVAVTAGTLQLQVFSSASRTISATTAPIFSFVSQQLQVVKNGVDQTMVANVWQAVENYGKVTAMTNRVNSSIVIDTTGPYNATMQNTFGSSASHNSRIVVNGTPAITGSAFTGTSSAIGSTLINLTVGDIVTGGALSALSGDLLKVNSGTSTSMTLSPAY